MRLDEYGVTSGVGKVKSINRFDNVFFNMHGKLCECSETVIKLNLERSVEAIIDAGKNVRYDYLKLLNGIQLRFM